jgi:putative glutamine amidotransferase
MFPQAVKFSSGTDQPMKKDGPRIGITMRIELETDRFYLARHYSEAVAAAGGVPVHIALIPQWEYVSSVMRELDGILLPGSDSDIDPLRYGREPHPALGSVHPIKDETDFLVLDEVENRAMPLFAICFGMQVLNVHRGGTLIQDIGSQMPNAVKHQQGVPRDRPSHAVKLGQGSNLAELRRGEQALVNSHHHQAVESIGRDLAASAWTADGLVEAIEDTRQDRFALGVQWHPELGWRQDDFSRAMFERFIFRAQLQAEAEAQGEAFVGSGESIRAKEFFYSRPLGKVIL